MTKWHHMNLVIISNFPTKKTHKTIIILPSSLVITISHKIAVCCPVQSSPVHSPTNGPYTKDPTSIVVKKLNIRFHSYSTHFDDVLGNKGREEKEEEEKDDADDDDDNDDDGRGFQS